MAVRISLLSVFLFLTLTDLPAQDDAAQNAGRRRVRTLLASYQDAAEQKDNDAKGRIMSQILAMGRSALLEVRSAKHEWETSKDDRIAELEKAIAQAKQPADAEKLRAKLGVVKAWGFVLDVFLQGLEKNREAAGVWWLPVGKDESPLRRLMRAYVLEWLDGDPAESLRLMEERVKAGPAAVDEARWARGEWLACHSKRLEEFRRQVAAEYAALERLAESGRSTRETENLATERIRSARASAERLE